MLVTLTYVHNAPMEADDYYLSDKSYVGDMTRQ